MKRFISCLLCLTLVLTLLPMDVIQAFAAEQQPFTIDDGYIQVQVSKQNGGFIIRTVEGDLLKKADNNKKLLFHNGEYDTSFVSYRVDYGDDRVEEYLFGGKYGDSSDPSRNGVFVSQDQANGNIVATWSVGELTFTQSISLPNRQSNEHGMVSIQLAAENNSSLPVTIKARLLLDTCLGEQDYGHYQVMSGSGGGLPITSEQVLVAEASGMPMSLYALDDPFNPGVTAYSVNSPDDLPYKIAFGHWNNLAASLFDFEPEPSLGFTNPYNDYLTADSAYALYYDLGSVTSGDTTGIMTYYGVYSRHDVPAANSVAVDATVPLRLELNDDKTGYKRLSTVGVADFVAGVTFENYFSETAKPLTNVVLSVQTTANLRPLSDSGLEVPGLDFGAFEPLNITYADVQVGNPITKALYFQAKLNVQAAYERITIGVYDVSKTNGQISADNLLGEKVIYILLPGSDGDIPQVSFASMTPNTIYFSGTRHLYLTVTNEAMLAQEGNWDLKAYAVGERKSVDIPHELISIKDGVMDIALTDDIKLDLGTWYLQLEWTDAAVQAGIVPARHQKLTGAQLRFVVSEDPKHKNDSYGVLCVVQYNADHFAPSRRSKNNFDGLAPAYRLEAFENEAAFENFTPFTGEYVEILLVFRGEFTANKYVRDSNDHRENTYYTAVSTKSLDPATQEYKVDNTITINGCMDFEGGTMVVYYENYTQPDGYKESSINVEFDGELLTSDARTSIWKGKALLTKIVQKEEFSLRPYDEDGNREDNFNDSTIRLVWPSVYGAGQTLAGMIFKLAYGELGVMKNQGREIGRVLSFSASLSLNFLKAVPGQEEKTTYWTKMQDLYEYYDTSKEWRKFIYSADEVNKLWDFSDVDEEKPKQKGVTAAVMVPDVLFGCGQGFVGVHFKAGIGIQNMIEGLPEIKGELEVNTINNWSFGFEGSMELATMAMEARLSFKSYNNIPVPDEIYFFVGGFKPGINIDAGGVVWLTGGGGGISNLYDTIFLSQAVPPLKLLLSATFSIIQVMDGRADISLGLTGISLKASDLKIFGNLKFIEQIYLGLEWYPDFDLQASLSVNFLENVIKGGGYIVLFSEGYEDFFFEIYLHAMLGVPESVPVIGGMTLLGVDLGVNSHKVWGGFKVLGVGYGITYYWGQDGVDFTTGGSMAQPTYPDLLGQKDIPVYFDAERDQTLFARFGTNMTIMGAAEVIEASNTPRLMAALKTDPDENLHMFNLGPHDSDSNSAAVVQISYEATGLENAKEMADNFKVNDKRDLTGNDFVLRFYDTENPENPGNPDANANVTFNGTTGQAACSFTVTDGAHYNTDWYISTGEVASQVILYNVGALPEVTTVAGTVSGEDIDLTWDGTSLDELDKLSFYLTKSNEKGDPEKLGEGLSELDGGIVLAVFDKTDDITAKTATVAIPADTPTDVYYIKAVYSKEDQVNGVVFSENQISYTNDNMPGECTIAEFTPAGNLEYRLELAAGAKTEGYLVTIYEDDGITPTDVAGLTYPKAESGNTIFTIGGSYYYEHEIEGKKVTGNNGLTGGKSYQAGVTPYNLIDNTIIYGEEVMTSLVALPAKNTPKVTITANIAPQTPSGKRPTYTTADLTFTAAISAPSSGEWILDDTVTTGPDDNPVDFQGAFPTLTSSVIIPLTGLAEGDHILTIRGSNAGGDKFKYDYAFTVDTTPPRLMLTTPVNGSLFGKDGSLKVSGVTDADARFTITSDGAYILADQTLEDLGETISAEGVFAFTTSIPDPHNALRRDLTISVADEVGNTTSRNIWVSHGGLAHLQELKVLVDNNILASGNIFTGGSENLQRQLALLGVTDDGVAFRLTDERNVSWQCQAVEGSAQVDENGVFTFSEDAKGLLVGRLEVATGAYRTAALSFSSDIPLGTVEVTSTIGGTVTGSGLYTPGDPVNLMATPHSGYSFTGWTIRGAAVANTGSPTITFAMPEGQIVTAHAEFRAITSGGVVSPPQIDTDTGTGVKAKKGELVVVEIPEGADPNTYVPYYKNRDGSKTFVPLSAVIDGKLYFIAPVDANYYFMDNKTVFKDTVGHWARSVIDFMAARTLFRGVGDDIFAPDQPMTRAMFVAVLHRLAGQPRAQKPAPFKDVAADAWYAAPVAWGHEAGIVGGMGNGMFAPNAELTREQMCAFIVRFIRLNGIDLPAVVDEMRFADAGDISPWAAGDVVYCQTRGLVGGYPDKKFLPQGKATRAENGAVLMRLIRTILGRTLK